MSARRAVRRIGEANGIAATFAMALGTALTTGALAALAVFFLMFVGVAQIIYVSAFVAEIVRSAIVSVPSGQVAAARSLGMRRSTILREILLPQAVRIAIPPLLNNALTTIKQTSYVSVVGVWELTYAAREVVERTLASFQIFLGVMAIYFVICYPLSLLARWCERRATVAH